MHTGDRPSPGRAHRRHRLRLRQGDRGRNHLIASHTGNAMSDS